MGKLATTRSFSDYQKLKIGDYKQQLNANSEAVTISHAYKGKNYTYNVKLAKTACNYGGYRFWWICPRCGRLATVLYCEVYFTCRHCISAKYDTQLMQPVDKLFKRIEAIRKRLKWQRGMIHGEGEKPKGMHYRTFNELVNEHRQLERKIIGIMHK